MRFTLVIAALLALAFPVAAADGDGDGIPDDVDNCSAQWNPAQFDADMDLYGNACDADFDQNDMVGSSDLNKFRACWIAVHGICWRKGAGPMICDPEPGGYAATDPLCDLNDDGFISPHDFASFKRMFAKPPGPSGLR